MENYLKGIAYEKQTKSTLLKINNQVYLWNEIPLDIFIESKIFENYADKLRFRKGFETENIEHGISDTGCDIFYFDQNKNEWIIVQCKNYTGTITLNKLAGFYDLILSTKLNGELYYTSTLSEPITRYKKDKINFINFPFIDKNTNIIQNVYLKLNPYDYQVEAYDKLKNKQRSILQLPCGMGKTLIAIMWAKQFDVVVIFSPLKQHAQQNLERFKNELNDYDQYILVDSDGIRDVRQLIPLMINKKIIFSVTYKSIDIINKLALFGNVGVVIDEFHNLTYDNITNENDLFYKFFTKDYNYLFVSATPKLFDYDDEYIEAKEITGNIEYKYEFGKAIKEGYICDYDVFVPDVTIKKEQQLDDVYKQLKITDSLNVDHDVKAHFLIRCMEENGHSKCITYSKDVEDANKLLQSFNRIKEYHSLELYIDSITSHTTQKQRNNILKEFQETHKKAIICSVRILDECIDIPKCDCVFMTSNQTNKIRMIQRICRANRKNKENPNKRTGIYMWTDAYNELTDLIVNLKEFDCNFTNEKVKICNISNNKLRCIKSRETFEKEYITMDQILIGINRLETWHEKLEKVKKYIDENKCRPSRDSTNKDIKSSGYWMDRQNYDFKNRNCLMKTKKFYDDWYNFMNNYKEYFKSNKEIWYDMFNKINFYFDKNDFNFAGSDDDQKHRMKRWIETQQTTYKTKKCAMKTEKFYNEWTKFINKHKEYFKSNEEIWYTMFNKIKYYFDKNDFDFTENNNEDEKYKMKRWVQTQQTTYRSREGAMKTDKLYNEWSEFTAKYDHFDSDEEHWNKILNKLKKYIDENGCRPPDSSTDEEIRFMGKWIITQRNNHKQRIQIMKNDTIYNKWSEFINDYKKYLRSNEEIWYDTFNDVKKYIDENNQKPSSHSEDTKKIGRWICTQQTNYRKRIKTMKSLKLYNEWTNFLGNYKQYF